VAGRPDLAARVRLMEYFRTPLAIVPRRLGGSWPWK
jgi:hypothetical protein